MFTVCAYDMTRSAIQTVAVVATRKEANDVRYGIAYRALTEKAAVQPMLYDANGELIGEGWQKGAKLKNER